MALAPDILDHILSFLQPDTTALKACSKSHPFLSKIAERYLYVNVAVHDGGYITQPDEYDLNFREIIKLLSDNPHIANYVRNLAFCISRPRDLADVSCVLPMFSRLTKVALRGRGVGWIALPDTFRRAFLECIYMKEVFIENIWNFQLSCLNNCKVATLSRLQYLLPTNFDVSSTAQLKSLSIEECDAVKIGDWVKTLSLHSLRLSGPSDTFGLEISRIPEFLPNTLIKLELDFKDQLRSSYDFSANAELSQINTTASVNFSQFQVLEELTIACELKFLRYSVAGRQSPLNPEPRWMLDSSIPSIKLSAMTAPSLKHLTLKFHVFFSPGCSRLPDPDILWSSLANLVAECSALSAKVEIKTHCETQGSDRIPPGMIHASFAGSKQLVQYVGVGVLVIAPDVSEMRQVA